MAYLSKKLDPMAQRYPACLQTVATTALLVKDVGKMAMGQELAITPPPSTKAKDTDVVLIDTAGRLQNKKNLMNELGKINKVVEREYPEADYRTYIVIDATTGQNALSQVEAFDEIIDMDGIILNKLDGTAKGGVVFAISVEKELPVCFIGVGEGIDDLLEFDAKFFIDELF